jgi:hypothetical protein
VRDPARVALAYTTDSRWRNRSEFLQGREAIEAFLTRKWNRELEYRLIKQVWAFNDNHIAVRFAYEWHDDSAPRVGRDSDGNRFDLGKTRTGIFLQRGLDWANQIGPPQESLLFTQLRRAGKQKTGSLRPACKLFGF